MRYINPRLIDWLIEDASGDSEDSEDDELPYVIGESAGDCVWRGSRRSVGSSFHRQGAAYQKKRFVIFRTTCLFVLDRPVVYCYFRYRSSRPTRVPKDRVSENSHSPSSSRCIPWAPSPSIVASWRHHAKAGTYDRIRNELFHDLRFDLHTTLVLRARSEY